VSVLRHPTVVRSAQVALGLIFCWAALAKINDLAAFALQLHNFRIVPVPLENLAAMTLPWIELTAAVALVLGLRPRRAGAILLTALLALFTVGVLLAMVRGLNFECGCFGKADATTVGWVKVLQNLGMLGVGLLACQVPAPARRASSGARAAA